MIIAHLGVFIFFIGVVISNLFQIESIQIMLPGDEIILTNHIFNLRNINYILGSNYYSIYGNVAVINKGDYINILFPEKRYYFIKGIYITKSVIYSNYFADIYAIIGDGNINNGWYTKYYYRPLMSFIWLGPLFFIFGAIFFIYNYINKFKYVNWY
jgi:cytochrome c-type biogenesis protein CcmF